MTKRPINFPIYGIIIVLSIGIGMLYIYKNISKEKRKNLYLYFLLYMSFALIFAKIFTILTTPEEVDFIKAGLSSLGGLIGTIIAAYIYEKIEDHNRNIIKYTILSMPLVYGLSKIACFIVGCCYGIPYQGIGYVLYSAGLKEKLFPIQIVETMVFLILFYYLNKHREEKEIIYKTIFFSSITKLLLDFLRYDHTKVILTTNQIVCILIAVITLVIWRKKKKNSRI